jgi:hypothetical protein
MDTLVVTLTRGCCASDAKSEILGVFLSVEQANQYIKGATIFGREVHFSSGTQTINLGDTFSGYVSLSIHRQRLTDPAQEQKKLHDLMEWLDDEPKIGDGNEFNDFIATKVIQSFPDTIGLLFSDYAVTLTDDGRWFIEAWDGG